MTSQPRRPVPRKMSRRERRTHGVQRPATAQPSGSPRRSYMVEPQPLDYTAEYAYIRRDLRRILIWASLIVVAMIALSFVPLSFG